MLYMLDTANLDAIRRCVEYYPVDGVTTNPTIISKEQHDFADLLLSIREIIGPNRMLHVQTTSTDCDAILEEARLIRGLIGDNFYLKVPISPEGLKATMRLHDTGYKVTVTAIFTQQQALLAAKAGADFVAPYVNRLDNIVSDGERVVSEIVDIFHTHDVHTKVLAASFKNVEQIHKIIIAGSDAVTVTPELFEKLAYHPLTLYAMDDFEKDWETVYGKQTILDLIHER